MTQHFKMPVPVKINGRSSSITNSFINGIIPCIPPTEKEVNEVLTLLGMKDAIKCAYCGDRHTEWDHFRPLVQNKRPTGYISEIHNLVPACGKCNQSKGNSHWKDWMMSGAKLSPYTRGVQNLADMIDRLDAFEKWSTPTKLGFEDIVDSDMWEGHWENCERIHKLMRESQILSDKIRLQLQRHVLKDPSSENQVIPQETLGMERYYEKKVGVIANTSLRRLLESNQVSLEEINRFTTAVYSKKIFNLGFPLLKPLDHTSDIKQQVKDEKGYNRYYSRPVRIMDKDYYLCSQWYEPSKKNLVKWIELKGLKLI